MKTFLNLVACVFVVPSADAGSSESFSLDDQVLAQFFESIDQPTQDKIFEANKAHLIEQACLAKRYRIARADLGLMNNDDKPFVINPFDDVSLVVKTREISNFNNGTSQMWIMDKVHSRLDIDIPGVTPEIKKWLNTVKLTVRSYRYQDNLQVPQKTTGAGISQNPFAGVIRSHRSVWGQWKDANNIYHMSPVTERGEYYLIVQQDSPQRMNDKRIQKRCGINSHLETKSSNTDF